MSDYIQDPNDSKKQVPGIAQDNTYDNVNSPDRCQLVKTPTGVIFGSIATEVKFFFGSSASYAVTAATQVGHDGNAHELSGAPTGSIITSSLFQAFGKPDPGTVLNIHPVAYSSSIADGSQVKFVYKSGKSTGGI